MPYATCGDQTLRATARDSTYYLLRDLRDPIDEFAHFGGGSIPSDRSYFSGHSAGTQIASGGLTPYGRDCVLTQHLLLFVTATSLLGIYFLPVAVSFSGGVKQVTALPKHITLKGSLYGPIYGTIVYFIPFPC